MNYLIPANIKKGKYILGLFRPIDLIIFGTGVVLTLILLLILPLTNTLLAIVAITPAAITGFLVVPIFNYHNVLCLLIEIYEFFTSQRTFKWRGWCYKNEK